MRSYERNGVTIDQCTECRGIFLDRGELERLVDAEAAYYDDRPSAPQHQQPAQPYGQQAPGYSQPAYGATGATGHDPQQQRTGSSAHGGPAPASQGSGSDLGKLASEVFKQVSAARSSSSSSSQGQYGTKRKKSFLDQLLG